MTQVNKEVMLHTLTQGHHMILNKIANLEANYELNQEVEELLYEHLSDFEEQMDYSQTGLNYEHGVAVNNVLEIATQIMRYVMKIEQAVKSGTFTTEVGPSQLAHNEE